MLKKVNVMSEEKIKMDLINQLKGLNSAEATEKTLDKLK